MISQTYFVTKNYSYSKEIFTIYTSYSKYIKKLDISNDTQKWRLKHLRGFLKYLDDKKISIENIVPTDVYNYILTLDGLSDRTIEHRTVCVRIFLNYLNERKKTKISGNDVLPKIKCKKESKLVNYYTDEEIAKIINTIDNKTDVGKRDLAIILLFAKLALRPRDVRDLKFENIKWDENKIVLTQSKTSWMLVLPIDDDIRYSLIDYIKNVRPKSELKNIFLKNEKEIFNDHFFYNVVDRAILNTDIELNGRKHGPYIFRHSRAKSLLDDGNSLNSISNVLGHTTTASTKVYLKIDFKELKKISLEVPTCKN